MAESSKGTGISLDDISKMFSSSVRSVNAETSKFFADLPKKNETVEIVKKEMSAGLAKISSALTASTQKSEKESKETAEYFSRYFASVNEQIVRTNDEMEEVLEGLQSRAELNNEDLKTHISSLFMGNLDSSTDQIMENIRSTNENIQSLVTQVNSIIPSIEMIQNSIELMNKDVESGIDASPKDTNTIINKINAFALIRNTKLREFISTKHDRMEYYIREKLEDMVPALEAATKKKADSDEKKKEDEKDESGFNWSWLKIGALVAGVKVIHDILGDKTRGALYLGEKVIGMIINNRFTKFFTEKISSLFKKVIPGPILKFMTSISKTGKIGKMFGFLGKLVKLGGKIPGLNLIIGSIVATVRSVKELFNAERPFSENLKEFGTKFLTEFVSFMLPELLTGISEIATMGIKYILVDLLGIDPNGPLIKGIEYVNEIIQAFGVVAKGFLGDFFGWLIKGDSPDKMLSSFGDMFSVIIGGIFGTDFLGDMQNIFEVQIRPIADILVGIGQDMGKIWDRVLGWFEGEDFKVISKFVSETLSSLSDFLGTLYDFLRPMLSEGTKFFKEFLLKQFNATLEFLKGGVGIVGALFKYMAGDTAAGNEMMLNGLSSMMSAMFQGIFNNIELVKKFGSIIAEPIIAAIKQFLPGMDDVKEKASELYQGAKEKTSKAISAVGDWFTWGDDDEKKPQPLENRKNRTSVFGDTTTPSPLNAEMRALIDKKLNKPTITELANRGKPDPNAFDPTRKNREAAQGVKSNEDRVSRFRVIPSDSGDKKTKEGLEEIGGAVVAGIETTAAAAQTTINRIDGVSGNVSRLSKIIEDQQGLLDPRLNVIGE